MLGFAYKRFDGKVPSYDALTYDDIQIINTVELKFGEVGSLIEQVKLRDALQLIMGVVRDANGYLDGRKPWITIKEDKDDAARSVYTILRVIDNLNTLLAPFLPFSAQKVHEYLGYDGQVFGDLEIKEFAGVGAVAPRAGLRRIGGDWSLGEKQFAAGSSAAPAVGALRQAGAGDRRSGARATRSAEGRTPD